MYTAVDVLVVSRLGTQCSSLDGMPSILWYCGPAAACRVAVGGWVWWRSFVLSVRRGGSSRRLSPPTSIRHPSAAPDIYGTLLLLFCTQRSTTLDSIMPFSR